MLSQVEGGAQRDDRRRARGHVQSFAAGVERHFQFEENRLFPELESAAPMAAGPTKAMRLEHEQVRQSLVDLLAAAEAEAPNDCIGIIETVHLLVQQHNAKE